MVRLGRGDEVPFHTALNEGHERAAFGPSPASSFSAVAARRSDPRQPDLPDGEREQRGVERAAAPRGMQAVGRRFEGEAELDDDAGVTFVTRQRVADAVGGRGLGPRAEGGDREGEDSLPTQHLGEHSASAPTWMMRGDAGRGEGRDREGGDDLLSPPQAIRRELHHLGAVLLPADWEREGEDAAEVEVSARAKRGGEVQGRRHDAREAEREWGRDAASRAPERPSGKTEVGAKQRPGQDASLPWRAEEAEVEEMAKKGKGTQVDAPLTIGLAEADRIPFDPHASVAFDFRAASGPGAGSAAVGAARGALEGAGWNSLSTNRAGQQDEGREEAVVGGRRNALAAASGVAPPQRGEQRGTLSLSGTTDVMEGRLHLPHEVGLHPRDARVVGGTTLVQRVVATPPSRSDTPIHGFGAGAGAVRAAKGRETPVQNQMGRGPMGVETTARMLPAMT